MPQRRWSALVWVVTCLAQTDAVSDSLFEQQELLNFSLQAPFRKINRERDRTVEYDGQLSYVSAAGQPVRLDVKIEPRGHARLKKNVCRFPPLRIIFNKQQVKNTLFRKQKKLKLVTQCDPLDPNYTSFLLKEYLAYRIFNQITETSFRVRLASTTYQELGGRNRTNFSFFLEDKKRFAKRRGLEVSKQETDAVHLDSVHLNQVSLFQMLIGNVDWSATSGTSGDCCHNFKLFNPGGEDSILAVPYDFDLSGIVNAKYAVPDKGMRLRSVRQRRYRGYCRNNALLDQNIALFNQQKDAIFLLIDDFDELSDYQRKNTMSYIRSFYRIINSPKRLARMVEPYCHKSKFIEVSGR